MTYLILAIVAIVIIIVLYKTYRPQENAENVPIVSSPKKEPPKMPTVAPAIVSAMDKQVYLISGDAVTAGEDGIITEKDASSSATLESIDAARLHVVNPRERLSKMPRRITMNISNEIDVSKDDVGIECAAASIIPSRRDMVSLAMSE